MMLKTSFVSSAIAFSIIGMSSGQAYSATVNLSDDTPTVMPTITVGPYDIETIASGLTEPYEFEVNGSDLVVTSNSSLLRINESGAVSTIAPLVPGSPGGVVVSGDDYFVGEYPTGSLLRVSQNGDKNTIADNLAYPIGVAKQGNDFIVVDTGVPAAQEGQIGNARLLRVSPEGNVSAIASENLGAPIGVLVQDDTFWVTDFALGRLLSVSQTGEVKTVATNLGQPIELVFDGKDFIVTDFADGFNTPGNGRILRVTKSGEVETLISGIGNPSGLLIQDSDLIFSDPPAGTVSRIPGFFNQTSVPEPSIVLGLVTVGMFGIATLQKRKLK